MISRWWLSLGLTLGLQAAPVSFEREVQPLLERRCNECHHPGKQRGGLDLTRLETMRRGGDELGAAVVPGRPEKSPLLLVLTGALEPKMPEQGDPLPDAEIDLLRRWIQEGAPDDSPVFSNAEVAFFEREIRPLLVERCFKCHAGDEPEHGLRLTSRQAILAGGRRGPAAVAGDPDASLLLQAIRHAGTLKMPRNGDRLSPAQVAAFATWIAMGLPWPADQKVLARRRRFTISEADRNHWAFRPLPPNESDRSIDSLLASHHRRLGLNPAPAASRSRLLRRVSYDLIGYPPTPDEMDAFLGDDSPAAFPKVVDRLLASPHFGRRWGRHWLDYTRNGSTGQPTRGPALDSERYAAWVAQCFNEDRPWDWFARVHLAGDQLPAFDGAGYSIDQALAAAVPLNGPRSFARAETETFVLMDKLDEGIEFLGRSLMGISLECARCHDHKFDPISQRDYYALLGFFQSSGYGPVPLTATTHAAAEAAIRDHRRLVSEKATLHGFIRRQGLLLNVGGGGRVKRWQATRSAVLAPMYRRLRELEIAVLQAELEHAERHEPRLAADLRTAVTSRREALARLASPDYNVSEFKEMGYFISGHKSQAGLIKRAAAAGRPELGNELKQHATYWEEERRRWGERSRFGGHARTDPEVAALAKAADRIAEISATLPANPDQPWTAPRSTHLYVRTDGGLRRAEDLAPLDAAAKARGLQFNSDNANRVLLHPPFIGDARLLERGDVFLPGELVPRGFPVFFGEEHPVLRDSGRRHLAEWLTRPGSIQAALMARTFVNRAWQKLFGEALCRTPKELGRLGDTPELPELLDLLATRFVAGGWSVKFVVREIVLSDAYRRDSVIGEEQRLRDEGNRYFARQAVRRLEYEPIANAMAWFAGGERFADPRQRDAALPAAADYRRHFDAAPVIELVDRRSASITATQALFMMNQRDAARRIAERLLQRLDPAVDARQVFRIVLQRPPTPEEATAAARFPDLPEFTTALLCANETIYLE